MEMYQYECTNDNCNARIPLGMYPTIPPDYAYTLYDKINGGV